jgi:hypothetical protein
MGAYGVLKRAEIRASLPADEQAEVERLEARRRRSPASERRLAELWSKAFSLHVPPVADPLVEYAAEVGASMRARQRGAD